MAATICLQTGLYVFFWKTQGKDGMVKSNSEERKTGQGWNDNEMCNDAPTNAANLMLNFNTYFTKA